MKKYTEFSFYLPFYDLIDDPDEGSHLEQLMGQLHISFDITALYHRYLSYGAGKGDIFVFIKEDDRDSFIFIDLFNGFTDQHNMVKLGVRCDSKLDEKIRNLLYQIYSQAELTSKFIESYDGLLKLEICSGDYPKEIRYGDYTYIKNIHYSAI